jgi:hypothetical protein
MGKKAKEHRRKVAKRNARLQQEKNIFNKAYQAAMEAKMAEIKEKFANLSEEEVNIALNNDVTDATVVEPTTETAN